jgi:meiotically up-regulated gene 157 (Mug157) protein
VRVQSTVLARAVDGVRRAVRDDRVTAVFENLLGTNLDAVTEKLPDGTVFVRTGDIPAMWLRDSAAQVRPYLLLCAEDPGLRELLTGVLRRQLADVLLDPWANAFNRGPDGAGTHRDRPVADPRVWERKYEVDSLCAPLELAYRLWRATGDASVLGGDLRDAAHRIIEVWSIECDHRRSPYRFRRPFVLPGDTLPRHGRGTPVLPTGMTWSGFRPSDDAGTYGYNVPGNMLAAVSLGRLATMAREGLDDLELATRATALELGIRAGLDRHGRVDVPGAGQLWAYEVDGLGSRLAMDDANMPSLLSIPLSGFAAATDPGYLRTRRWLLSPANPTYARGTTAIGRGTVAGIGSPHTPPGWVWPIALAVEGLTTRYPARRLGLLRTLVDTDAGTGRMHESFDPDDPTRFTRPWFSWADAMFCELALACAGIGFATEPDPR